MGDTNSGRRSPTHTKLGKMLYDKGIRTYHFAALANINPRSLTDILAGRKGLTDKQIVLACRVLKCRREDVVGIREGYNADGSEKSPVVSKPVGAEG